MKITGLYYFLRPHVPKMFDLNIFRSITIILIVKLIITILWLAINIFYYNIDIFQAVQYFMLSVSSFASLSKMYYTVRYSGNIWDCIQLTSIHLLSYKYHNRKILEIGRRKSKSFSTIFTILWLCVGASWLMSPFISTNSFIDVKVGNNITYRYRLNVLNLIFPVNDKFYNEHFLTYYCIESIMATIWCYFSLTFDITLISMCLTFSYQLRTIENSFRTFGYYRNKSKSKL